MARVYKTITNITYEDKVYLSKDDLVEFFIRVQEDEDCSDPDLVRRIMTALIRCGR